MAGGALSFREDPFRLTPDRRYIFETDGFRRAFAMLLAGVRARRGAMLLTGPSGTGKTTLLQGLLGKLQQDGATVFWRFHPDIPGYDLIGSCLAELEITDAPADPIARAESLAKALKTRTPSQPAVLIVDEAGQFADAQLAEIIALPAATGGAVQVVLAGLPVVADRLEGDGLFALKDAIALRAEIGPLGRNELGGYIAHRCRVAGQSGPLVFEPAAVGRVFNHTGGVPRLVNRLCATALFFAPAGAKQISPAIVDEAARACAGEATFDQPQVAEDFVPAAPPLPAATAASVAPDAPAKALQPPAPQEAQSEVHRTLAEAERAWISGGAATPMASIPAAREPAAAPKSIEIPPVELTSAQPMELTTEVPERVPEAPSAASPEAARVRRRSPALRIAASVFIVAGSAAALMAILWPTRIGHDYLAESAPAKTVARLFVAEGPVVEVATEPARIVADAAVPPEQTPPVAMKMEPVEVEPEVAAMPAPPDAKPEAVVKPEPVGKPQRNAAKREAPPEPVIARAEPAPEPPPVPPASLTPVVEPLALLASPGPAPAAVLQPDPPPPVPASEPPVEAASPAPEPASEPAALAATLSAIEPANGPIAATETAVEETPVAAPVDLPKAEPEPSIVAAAIEPKIETPAAAPAAKPADAPAVAMAIPPSPRPSTARTAQVSAPAADPTELRQLMARGDEMLRLGDPASARLFYERAAERGHARAYAAVGRTYDPLALQRLNIRGGGANGTQALDWYRRGVDAGDKDAEKAASDLAAWMARPR